MASVNKVIVLGNLGRDPETRYTADGAAITNVSIATTRRYKDASGQQQEETEWHRVAFFGRLAEIAGEYLKKGRPVYVEGRLRTRKWQDKDGQDRYTRQRPSRRATSLTWTTTFRSEAGDAARSTFGHWGGAGTVHAIPSLRSAACDGVGDCTYAVAGIPPGAARD